MIIREIFGMTRYLTEATAWLLLQKAVAAGEISDEEAQSRRYGQMTVQGGEPGPDGAAGIPPLKCGEILTGPVIVITRSPGYGISQSEVGTLTKKGR